MNWYTEFARTVNSGESRSIILHGETSDLQRAKKDTFLQLIPTLLEKTKGTEYIPLVYELNGPIRVDATHYEILRDLYSKWKEVIAIHPPKKLFSTQPPQENFDIKWQKAIGNPPYALELLRQLCVAFRYARRTGGFSPKSTEHKLFIVIESADFLFPVAGGDISRLTSSQFGVISIVKDWTSDPEFIDSHDTVCFVGESIAGIHPAITTMPQVKCIEVPLPSIDIRREYLNSFSYKGKDLESIASNSAGMSLYSLRKLIMKYDHLDTLISQEEISQAVADDISTRLGPGVVEFKTPKHTLEDVVGFSQLKQFIRSEVIPRFLAPKDQCLTGAAVAGPIGSGKTFIFEAMAAELKIPVMVLKNIRSQWYGQTDVVFEKLQRVLSNLDKVLIFVDEADTQFGGVGKDVHETERRLTGKLQAMMSDSAYKGKVFWLLMTARIDQLSPDLRRPGRAGDLIIPVLDPTGDDRMEFIKWVFPSNNETQQAVGGLIPSNFSSASFASLKSYLEWAKPTTIEDIKEIVKDIRTPPFQHERRMQAIQAMLNCTRKSLLPENIDFDILEQEYQNLLKII